MKTEQDALLPATRTTQTLRRLSEALGVPVETFRDGRSAQASAHAGELLTLWVALKGEPDRLKVLAFLRGLVDTQAR